ncbi:MAG: aldo/keto reductase [Clostridiales bacterium]|nr:aldo/keto reductase [Clostridiales bacterium]
MLYRELGKTGKKVSILGFGCMRFPHFEKDEKKIDEKQATKMLRYAIDNGLNYVDTAYPYHGGMSEPFVGRALRDGYREKVFLATKLPTWLIKSREDMDKYLNEQLKKLQTDCVDFYLIHTLNRKLWEDAVENGIYDFMDEVIKDGRVKHIGFSFHDHIDVFKEIVDAYPWEFCQIQFNYVDLEYQAGLEGLMYARERGLGVIVMEPLRGGKLASDIPCDVQKIWDRARIKKTAAEWALKYIWNYPEVDIILSGMSDLSQVKENILSAGRGYPDSLSSQEINALDKVSNIYKSKIKVDCTLCKYCMPCPVGVNIPICFNIYNNAFIFENIGDAKRQYNSLLKKEVMASECVECGKCEEACPQFIPIIKKLKDVSALLEDQGC